MMDAPLAACIIAGCLLAGGVAGGVEKFGNDMHYEGFINNPDNYHLVDDRGNPVSQEAK